MDNIGLLLEMAEQGDARALFELGLAYFGGRQVDKDLEQAVDYFQQAFELGLEEAIYQLAQIYGEGGPGLEKDSGQAFYWWLQAARYGRLESAILACYRVGQAYAEGLGVVKDLGQARFWLEKAADQGLPEARVLLDQLGTELS
jgi:TPR repeat protein